MRIDTSPRFCGLTIPRRRILLKFPRSSLPFIVRFYFDFLRGSLSSSDTAPAIPPFAKELFPVLRDLHSSGNPTILRLIDGLFYSLGRAELHVATEDTVEDFQNFRHSASIHLSTLVR